MSSSGASFPITFSLVADDNASGPIQSIVAVLKEGKAATAEQLSAYQDLRSETRLQTGAMSTLASQLRLADLSSQMFSRTLSAMGSVGQTLLSIVTATAVQMLAMQSAEDTVSATTQKVTDDQNYYNQMVQQFGANSVQALNALDQLHSDESALIQDDAQLSKAKFLNATTWAGIGLSIAGMGAPMLSAITNMRLLAEVSASNSAILDALGVSSTVAAAGETTAAGATGLFSGAMGILDAVMDVNPILLIIAAIGAVVAIVGIATNGFTNWGGVMKTLGPVGTAFGQLWQGIQQVAGAAWDAIQTGWDDFLGALYSDGTLHLGLINVNVAQFTAALKTAFNDAVSIVEGVWSDFTGLLNTAWNEAVAIFTPVWETFWNTFGTPITAAIAIVKQALQDFVNMFIDAINGVINTYDAIAEAINAVSSKVGITLQIIPDIPHVALATGGIVNGPTNALIGENGPEVVAPLPAGGLNSLGGQPVVNVYVDGSILTEQQVLQAIDRGLYTMRYSRLRT